jgi:hypothetical protein
MHALGALREPVEAIQMRTQAPHAMCAQSGLGAATLAVQAHRDVELPGAGRRPLTGLFGSVAESGERKTTVDRIALAPAYRIEEKWRQEREGQINAFVNDLDAWKAAREAAKKKSKGDRAAIRDALNAIGPNQSAATSDVLVEDFSPEALVLHLRDAGRGRACSREGGVLVGAMPSTTKAMRLGPEYAVGWQPIRRARADRQRLPARSTLQHAYHDAA